MKTLNAEGELCFMSVWFDGVRGDPTPGLESYVDLSDIEAVEVYVGRASLPLQYGAIEDGCGAVLIWTKHGPVQR